MKMLCTAMVTGLLLLGSGCRELPLEGGGDAPRPEATEAAAAIAVIMAPGDLETSSTICQAFERHLERIEMEAAAEPGPDLEARVAALETVISDLCR